MPKLSDTMEEGKILRWLKHPGDQVHHGEPIAEVETDKADMVMEAFDDGLLDEIVVKEGESAKVGAVIAVLRSSAGEVSRPPAERAAAASEPRVHFRSNKLKPTVVQRSRWKTSPPRRKNPKRLRPKVSAAGLPRCVSFVVAAPLALKLRLIRQSSLHLRNRRKRWRLKPVRGRLRPVRGMVRKTRLHASIRR